MADVESVEFSSTGLVWIGKVGEDSTVGGLKEANGLETEYSADLTQEHIAEINAQTVEAGDWVLISLQPFTSEETLTVTMQDGDQFVVRMTDYQSSTNVDHETRDLEGKISDPNVGMRMRDAKGSSTLETPNPQKTLLPNTMSDGTEDGTYKLSLSVTGDILDSTKTQKSNILFIMDRSSSMRRDVGEVYIRFANESDAIAALNDGTYVYGDVNGAHPSLRYSEGKWQ